MISGIAACDPLMRKSVLAAKPTEQLLKSRPDNQHILSSPITGLESHRNEPLRRDKYDSENQCFVVKETRVKFANQVEGSSQKQPAIQRPCFTAEQGLSVSLRQFSCQPEVERNKVISCKDCPCLPSLEDLRIQEETHERVQRERLDRVVSSPEYSYDIYQHLREAEVCLERLLHACLISHVVIY